MCDHDIALDINIISNNTMISIVKYWLGIERAVKNTIVDREMSIKGKGDIFVSPRYMPPCWIADKTQFENSTKERKRWWRFKQSPARFSFLGIFFHFHFSFSISSHFIFTFTSRKRVKEFYFSLFTSRKSESYSNFTFFSQEKKK